ncbi:uncharacterized protein LY89DRAFT_677138 [Mollisia scopiformis]|uniref:WSC domain-containing protein n=1 Tax=Mollisia scopiformis TaxID=149040 RepID=A0A132B769_MOLSC|nr:uncharacterized protein LY89DRAFT_677138 [Mollisia scopiformis]KUJ08258.1 hypothetical protein LY89DRAFT_677138 [Mollisia scopiformis]
MDPTMVSSSLNTAWKFTANALELFYAKPLVYTPTGAAHEQVIAVSNQNIIRVFDGLSGAVITSRTLLPPFASVNTNCGDIPNTVGITGTPIIDPTTDIMYFFSKGYQNGKAGPQGTINGAYRFYAVKLPSLADVFPPVMIDGHFANNDHTRYFFGGTVLNRPGLAMMENSVIAGFGGHCDNFNYTGMLVAVSKTNGAVTNIQAMEASPYAPSPQTLVITVQGGGKAGIWHSGMGLAGDSNRVFFVTGNARGAGQNGGAAGKAASGKVYLSTLEQAVVDMSVSTTGAFTQADYFEPYAYDSLNGGDRDFGSSGVALLDGTTFVGGGVTRVAVAGGKYGHIYVMDANNLGGFAGAAGGDKGMLLSGVGSYPMEGGYIYFNPTGQPLICYKLTHDSLGRPNFAFAGQTAAVYNGQSVPTVTSNRAKSVQVWLADGTAGLVAFKAVPVGGVLVQIKLPVGASTGGALKYQRAVFGAGRAYMAGAGKIIALGGGGTAASVPLSSSPSSVAFGLVSVVQTSTVSITLSAASALTITSCSTTSSLFQCGASGFPITVASGSSFNIPITFNLTDANILAYQNADNSPLAPTSLSSLLDIFATDSTGTVSDISIPLSGTVVASGGYLVVYQTTVNFARLPAPLTFTGFAYQDYYGDMTFINVTSSIVGNGYTSTGFPALHSQIQPGASITIQLFFGPKALGIAASYLTLWSDGGYTDILMTGNAQNVAFSSLLSSTSILATSSSVIKSSSSFLLSSAKTSSSSKILTSTSLSLIPGSSTFLSSASILSSSSLSSSLSAAAATSSSTLDNPPSFPTSLSASASSSLSAASNSEIDSSHVDSGSSPISSSTSSSAVLQATTSTSRPSSNTASTTISIATTLQTSTYIIPIATASSGFAYQGCFRDVGTGHALPLLVANNSMTPELCLKIVQSLAAKPTPTILPYYYVEYARECYGRKSFTWESSAITSLTGTKACTDICSGSLGASSTGTAKCGGSRMFDLYVAASAPTLSAVYTLTK